MSINEVRLLGTVTREPTLVTLPSGVPLVEVTLAVNDARWDAEIAGHVVSTMFVLCQFWDDVGTAMLRDVIGKGDELFVQGRLDQKEVTKRDGSKDRKTRVHVLMWRRTRESPRQRTNDSPFEPIHEGVDPWG